jgi:hypothetical protein
MVALQDRRMRLSVLLVKPDPTPIRQVTELTTQHIVWPVIKLCDSKYPIKIFAN